MTQSPAHEIAAGTVLEFFDNKEIICGVCLAAKNHRLNVLTEHNREINLAQSRILHMGDFPLDVGMGRDGLLQRLASTSALRSSLMAEINVEDLWSLLDGENIGFDARGMAEFVFSDKISEHHVAAVQRVLLQDRLFFHFKDGLFHPRPGEKVELRRIEIEREEQREAELEQGSRWLHALWNRKPQPSVPDLQERLINYLKGFCLFGQEFQESSLVKEMLKLANIPPQQQSAFRLLVRLGIWEENENLYLHEQNISADFPKEILDLADEAVRSSTTVMKDSTTRRDLRDLPTITIDSALTRDYDDALSLRSLGDGLYEVGVHIADAAEFIAKGVPLDEEAQSRASSIYLPDGKIAMLPPSLSEGICSLRAGEERLALSFLFVLNATGAVQSHEITPSVIKVHEQLTYQEVNSTIGEHDSLRLLYELALKLREERLSRGAVILPLPEIHVHVNSAGMIHLSRYEKETPSQIMVSEWMIAANALAGSFLAVQGIPAIFRSQAECKPETDFTQSEHEIFRIYRQRRLFARAELDAKPEMHCSLAVPNYTTITSPIRRYMDLVVQRQLKYALANNAPLYSAEELRQLIVKLGAIQSKISFIQRKWTRYWILKYMEQEDMQTLNALILDQTDRFAHLLIPDFLIETNAPLLDKTRLPRGEMMRVKIERLNPREDVLKVQLPEIQKS